MADDLWPNFEKLPKFRAPAQILREQAELLGEKTGNVIRAEVLPLKVRDEGRLLFGFSLIAPALNNYRLRVLNLGHEVRRLYPAKLTTMLQPPVEGRYPVYELGSESAFVEALKSVLGHETTVHAVQSLWVQSEDFPVGIGDDDEDPFEPAEAALHKSR